MFIIYFICDFLLKIDKYISCGFFLVYYFWVNLVRKYFIGYFFLVGVIYICNVFFVFREVRRSGVFRRGCCWRGF